MPSIEPRPTSSFPPFLKWAGGKRWLLESQPEVFDVSFSRYLEPFLGSGAIFFSLLPRRAILSDRNQSLIETYSAIRDNWQRVFRNLQRHQRMHSKEYYYKVRADTPRNPFTRAAKFIYLNRTCFNGLYRVNLDGRFNVPIGTKNSVLLPTDDFARLASILSKVTLKGCDFEDVLSKAKANDFVFIDPPYTVKHNNNGFVKYNESLFSWDDQIRLSDAVKVAVNAGAKVLVTNAYHSSVRRLYSGVGEIIKVQRASLISGKATARGKFEEMIVKCY